MFAILSKGSGAVRIISGGMGAVDHEPVTLRLPATVTLLDRQGIRDRVQKALDRGAGVIELDLVDTRYMDSAVLGTLCQLAPQVQMRGAVLRLVNPSDEMRSLFALVRLEYLLDAA